MKEIAAEEYINRITSKMWEIAKRITSLSPFMLDRLFEVSEPAEVFSKYTWEEVADILLKYDEEEDAKKIRMENLCDKLRNLVGDGYSPEEIFTALKTVKGQE